MTDTPVGATAAAPVPTTRTWSQYAAQMQAIAAVPAAPSGSAFDCPTVER